MRDIPDVGPDDPSFPENEGPMREYPRVVQSFTPPPILPSGGALLRVPLSKEIRERDILWCESLIRALGQGIIDTYQMAGILRILNEHRPEKTDEPSRSGRLPESPA